MVNSGGTPEEQIARLEADSKSQAKGLSLEELRVTLNELKEAPFDALSEKTIADRAVGVLKSSETARRQFLLSGGEERHRGPLSNLLRRHALLTEYSKKVAASKSWKQQAEQNREEQRQAAQQIALHQPAPQCKQQNAHIHHNAPSAARGAGYGGGAGSRGRSAVSQATAPNPSTINNLNPSTNRTRAHNAALELARGLGSPALHMSGEDRDFLDGIGPNRGAGPSSGLGTCSACDERIEIDELEPKEGIGLICLRCEKNQHEPVVATRNRMPPEDGWKRATRERRQSPARSKPNQVQGNAFYGGEASGHDTSRIQRPQLRGNNQSHQNASTRVDKRGYNPLVFQNVNGGARVLQGPQQQQRQVAIRPRFPQNQYRSTQKRNTRQTNLDRVVKVDTHGTDANPITLCDTDDDSEGNSDDESESGMERAVIRAASLADKSFKQRVTRLASGAINPSTVMRLQGLRCLMPPEGGPGAVEFTAADLGRLAPDEFLNDTAIDYYLRYLRMKLEKERPEDAARCYFFNSFFYKKLSEKTGTGGAGNNAAAAASYAKVKKWTRGVDIFAKDYVFVPIHDHLHWSLMIICHPGAEVPKQTRKRPGSAALNGNTNGGSGGRAGNKKRGGTSDVVVVLDEDEDDNPTITAHRKANLNHQKGNNTAGGEEEDEEIEKETKKLEVVQDPRLVPHPEPFFLHLDSLNGGHSTDIITKTMKSYLKCEWDARIDDPKAPEDSVPQKWAAEQAQKIKGKKKSTLTSTAAAANDSDNDDVDAGPCSDATPVPKRIFSGLEKTKMPVPKQDNHCDCGLFVCAFVEFFIASLPKALNISALNTLKKNYNKDGIDLWEGSMRTASSTGEGEEEPAWYPGFLTKHWFKHEIASNLRWELLRMVLVHMSQAAGVMDATGRCTLEQIKKSIPVEQVDALLDEIETAGKYQKDGNGYTPPDIWRHQGIELKMKRAEKRKRQEEESKDKELAMQMQQEEEEKRILNTRSSRGKPLEMESSSEEEEEEIEKPQKKKRGLGISFLDYAFNKPESSSQRPAWHDPSPPVFSHQEDGPDKDFGIHLEEEVSEGDYDSGDRVGPAALGGDDKVVVEKEEEDPEAGVIDIMSTENTVLTELGRRYVHGGGGDDSEAAKAAAAAAAATAPSPTAPFAGVENADGISDDSKEYYHDAVEIIYEDKKGEGASVSLLDPSFADLLDDDGGDNDNDDHDNSGGSGAAFISQQNKTTNTSTRRLPTHPRRSNIGKQEAKEVLEATKIDEAVINSNEPPPDLDKATRCIISREHIGTNVTSAKLVLQYDGIPPFEVQLFGRPAFSRISHWYLLWGKDLPKTCEHVLPNGLEQASVHSAAKFKFLLQQGADYGDDDERGAASLPTTEELTDHDHGTVATEIRKEEEMSRLKDAGKYRQSVQGSGACGGRGGYINIGRPTRREALNTHTHFNDNGDPIVEDEVVEIGDEDEQPPTGKRKINTKTKRATDTAIGHNQAERLYEGEYAFDAFSQEHHEEHRHRNLNKPKNKQPRITPDIGKGNRTSNYTAGKLPPVSPRRGGNTVQRGPRTQGSRKMVDAAAIMKANLMKVKGNNANAGQNNQRRAGGWQRKGAATVDLTEEPVSPKM